MAWHVDDAWLRWLLKFGANDADDAWLASQLKAFQKDLGANDADDEWLGSLLKAFQKKIC